MEWLKDWAVPLSAGATLLLAVAAFWAIWQNYQSQKKERREKLLNEIIEWAADLMKAPFWQDINAVAPKDADLETSITYSLIQFSKKGIYIKQITLLFDRKLTEAVDKVIETLESCIDTYAMILKNDIDKDKDAKDKNTIKAIEKSLELERMATKVIEEAAKIKTQDIG